MIHLGALVPHPPLIVPGVGRESERAKVGETIRALGEVDRLLAEDPPETLVVFTPHGTVYSDAVVIYADGELTGDLRQFGVQQDWRWENDPELVERIAAVGRTAGLPVYPLPQREAARGRDAGLDHGVLVPLSFFDPSWAARARLVVIPLSFLPLEELYRFGTAVAEAAGQLGRKTAIIASGDLSHCLQPGAPAPYDPRGAEFDRKLMELLGEEDVTRFFRLDPVLVEKAAECGFRSLIMLLGTFDAKEFRVKVHSYQGPFGVGYGVATFHPTGASRESLVPELFGQRAAAVAARRAAESPLVRYARRVVEAHVRKQPLPQPEELDDYAAERAGVFVSLKKHGQLRGCIGTIEPTQANLAAEIRQNAISAASHDHRFDPVEPEELADLTYSVDVLQAAEAIDGPDQLDPDRYGVIVSRGGRRGLLLPNIEGVETAAEQVAIAKRKAGIGADEPVQLERFEVVRYY
jgi:AmmeMemoRadiSam system protein A